MSADTVAAISTPLQTGAIAMVRISGPRAKQITASIFRPHGTRSPLDVPGYTAVYGNVVHAGELLDDAVVFVYTAPKSYTGEDVTEICCHGGVFTATKLLEAVLDAGAVLAEAGEFTKRAFLNGKLDLARAESVADQIAAASHAAGRAALAEREGVLTKSTEKIADRLILLCAHISAWCDYPEEDVEELGPDLLAETCGSCADELDRLVSGYERVRFVKEGVTTAIVGKPNVGKSTLMNMFSGDERSIVTDLPGTTRDIVENTVRIGDIVLRLADTAGIRQTGDRVEQIGVELAKKKLAHAALVLFTADASAPADEHDREILDMLDPRNTIVVLNKSDKTDGQPLFEVPGRFGRSVQISAKTGEGALELEGEIAALTGLAEFDPGAPHIANERQLRAIKSAVASLREAARSAQAGVTLDAVGVTISEAVESLHLLSGKNVSQEIIDAVFENFCVGK